MAGHSKRKHSEFSPSAAKRWMTCPGSVRLSRTVPPQRESRAAREGTEAHECLEFIVKRYGDRVQAVKEAVFKWPAEMVEHALNSAIRLFSPDLRPSEQAKLLIEKRVVLSSVTHRLYGTLDYAWLDHWGTLTVIDYKYGMTPVTPIDDDGAPNPQLMIYALGLAAKHHFDFEAVKLAILQPRTCREGEDPVSAATVTIKRLREFERQVAEAVKAANHPAAPLVAGDHCRWCPAAATCPENSRKALADTNIAFDIETGIEAAPSPTMLTPATLPKILAGCDALEAWIEAVREYAFKLAEDGQKIPGYKLVAKRAQRVWLPNAEQAALAEFDAPDIYDAKFLSPAQLEKKLGVKAKAFTAKYTSAVSSGFNLVPEKDKRSEVTSTAVWDHE